MGIWFSWYNIPLALISLSWKGLAFDSPFLHNFLSFSVIISVGRIFTITFMPGAITALSTLGRDLCTPSLCALVLSVLVVVSVGPVFRSKYDRCCLRSASCSRWRRASFFWTSHIDVQVAMRSSCFQSDLLVTPHRTSLEYNSLDVLEPYKRVITIAIAELDEQDYT
jgi:hypothetical protein